MREIKFRAWDKENKFFWDDEAIAQEFENFRTDNDYDLMQFTGLKDKNGKEIYEGDVFLIKAGDGQRHHVKVVYEAPSFDVEDKKGVRCWNIFIVVTNGEIIGNIYENPELLT